MGASHPNELLCDECGFDGSYAHHDVHVRGVGHEPRINGGFHGELHEVIIGCSNEVIARHQRSYAKADMIFDPLHFLPLIEQKVGALDQAFE